MDSICWLRLVIIALAIVCSSQRWMVINEFNADASQKLETTEFVELKMIADEYETDLTLNFFYLIVIEHTQKGLNPLITTVIKLVNQTFNENRLYVVGGTNVTEADIRVPHENIMFRHHFQTKQQANFIPNGNRHPIGIALLYTGKEVEGLEITAQRKQIPIDYIWKKIIKDHILDLVVVGRRAYTTQCQIFTEIYSKFIGTNYMLRDFDEAWKRDLTLNRCTAEGSGFLPFSFRLGTPTPNAPNNCRLSTYVFENHLIRITTPLIMIIPNMPLGECSGQEEPVVFQSVITDLVTSDINQVLQTTDQCTVQLRDSNVNQIIDNLESSQERLRSMGEVIENEWDTTKHFNDIWLTQIDFRFPRKMPIKSIREKSEIQKWFIFNSNTNRYRCRLCSKYFNEFAMDKNLYNRIADKDGESITDNLDWNSHRVNEHHTSAVHVTIVNKIKKYGMEKMQNYFIDLQTRKDVKISEIAATSRMFRTIYAEIRANVPLNQHKTIVNLQKTHGVNLGIHYGSRWGATEIMLSISNQMHAKLLDYIKTENRPFSIIVDTSDDYNKFHYLTVLFQTLENNRPTVFFYRLIKLGRDETASGLFKALEDELVEDGLTDYFKKNLVGFTSDAANVMSGTDGGFVAFIRKFVSPTKVYGNKCAAHRLQTVMRNSMKFDNTKFLSHTFENIVNSVHSFFYSHSHKRIQFLRDTADELGIKFYELKYIYKIRWVKSLYENIDTIKKQWKLVVICLQKIINNESEFDLKTRVTASSILGDLKNKNFLLILHFLEDILQKLSFISLEFQKKGGSIIGKDKFIQNAVKAFTQLKEFDGSIMNGYLNGVNCKGILTIKCKVEDYESIDDIKWQGIDLISSTVYPSLTSLRINLLSSLNDNLYKQFPDFSASNYDIFTPQKIIQNKENLNSFGKQELKIIYDFFEWKSLFTLDLLYQDWKQLLDSMIKSDIWCDVNDMEPHIFWAKFLNIKTLWTSRTLRLIKTILVIPVGSSDAERSFSYLNLIEKVHRNINEVGLEALIRIKFNGPQDVERFKATEYAHHFVFIEQRLTADSDRFLPETQESSQGEDPNNIYYDKSTIF